MQSDLGVCISCLIHELAGDVKLLLFASSLGCHFFLFLHLFFYCLTRHFVGILSSWLLLFKIDHFYFMTLSLAPDE